MCTLFFFDYRLIFSNFFCHCTVTLFSLHFFYSLLFFFLSPSKNEKGLFAIGTHSVSFHQLSSFIPCQLSLLLSSSSSIFSVFSSGVFARCAFPGPFPSGLAHPSSNSVPSHSLPPSFFYLQSRSSYFHPFQPPQHPYLPFYDLSFRPPPSPPLSSLSLTRRIFRFVLH